MSQSEDEALTAAARGIAWPIATFFIFLILTGAGCQVSQQYIHDVMGPTAHPPLTPVPYPPTPEAPKP